MVTDLLDYRRNNQLKKLNILVKELLEVRQYLKIFEDLNLPNYQAMLSNLPEGVEGALLKSLHERQGMDYYNFFELRAREQELKEAIQQTSDSLDELL